MKRFLPILALVALALATTPAQARVSSEFQITADQGLISNRDVNRILKIAADEWSMTVGAAHQAYNAGQITITPYPEGGASTYMVLRDGFCILVVLEDKL